MFCFRGAVISQNCFFQHKLLQYRVRVNSAPELDFLANSKSNSGIGIELELALPSPDGIGIELPSFELELNSELPSWNSSSSK